MSYLYQTTIEREVCFSGIGVHKGVEALMRVRPAGPDTGILWRRSDLATASAIPSTLDSVSQTRGATVLGDKEDAISTVEHFLSAVYALGIDNLDIEISGPEVPLLDGGAWAFFQAMKGAGQVAQPKFEKTYLVVRQPLSWSSGAASAKLQPHQGFSIEMSYTLSHDKVQPCERIGQGPFQLDFSPQSFASKIAKARTFGFEVDLESMRKIGLAKGVDPLFQAGSICAVDNESSVMRSAVEQEPRAHKVLDFLGDVLLSGSRYLGAFQLSQTNHGSNRELAEYLLQSDKAEIILASQAVAEGFDLKRHYELAP